MARAKMLVCLSSAVWATATLVSSVAAQTLPESVVVKRPDGSIILPYSTNDSYGSGSRSIPVNTLPESVTVRRPDGTLIKPLSTDAPSVSNYGWEARIEQSRREREGAMQRPSQQIEPTMGR